MSNEEIRVKNYKLRDVQRIPRIIVEFYNKDGVLLTTLNLPHEDISSTTNQDELASAIFYSIDLKSVPMSVLDQTVKIDITRWRRD